VFRMRLRCQTVMANPVTPSFLLCFDKISQACKTFSSGSFSAAGQVKTSAAWTPFKKASAHAF